VNVEALNSASDDTYPAWFEGEESGVTELYFASSRPGGLGLVDIYLSRRHDNGTFETPEIVPELSGPAGDAAPEVSHNGREMFLQSNRPGSKGLYDLWVSTRPSVLDPWTPPVLLEGLSSRYGDAGPSLSSDNLTLLFNSNRLTSGGSHDLYLATRVRHTGRRE
jgi:hypothetical protein